MLINQLQSLKHRFLDLGFAVVHNKNLVYVTCWEDPRLDRIALNLQGDDTVLVITSAGCNTLDYCLDAPKEIYAVDVNPKQNALLELKIAGIRELDFEQFFQLFGQGKLKNFQNIYTQNLRSHLSLPSRKYWDIYGSKFFDGQRSFYFRGTTGNFALLIKYYIDRILKIRPSFDAILNAKSLEEQQEIYHQEIYPVFWKDYLNPFINSDLVLWMLGVPRQQRQQMERYLKGNIAEFVKERCENVFSNIPLKDNYFWRVFLNGEYSRNCCPEYLKPNNFELLKSGLVDRISVETNTITNFLKTCPTLISHFVLLDHMDWLSQSSQQELQKEWQAIVAKAETSSRILFRSGAFQVEYLDNLKVFSGGDRSLKELLVYNNKLANQLHSNDRIQTYGSFYIANLVID